MKSTVHRSNNFLFGQNADTTVFGCCYNRMFGGSRIASYFSIRSDLEWSQWRMPAAAVFNKVRGAIDTFFLSFLNFMLAS